METKPSEESKSGTGNQKSTKLKKLKFNLVAIAISLFIGVALFLSSYEDTTPLWLKWIGIVICIGIIAFAALRNLKWLRVEKDSLPKINTTVKKAATWIVILVCIILVIIFIPWEKISTRKSPDPEWVSVDKNYYLLTKSLKPKEVLLFTIDPGWSYWYDPGKGNCIVLKAKHNSTFKYEYCGGQYVPDPLGQIVLPGRYYITTEKEIVMQIYKKSV